MTRDVTPRFKEPKKPKKSTAAADREWSVAVRRRDGYRCQFPNCGVYDKHIHTHHIASRKQRPDLRHDVSNGLAVCLEHHHWLHANPDQATELGLISHERYESRS